MHVSVEPIGPSWQETSKQYWLELMTKPPVNIVATGSGNDLAFDTGRGAIAQIPPSKIGTFEHRMADATE